MLKAEFRRLSSAKSMEDIFVMESETQLELTGESSIATITDMALDSKGNYIISDGVHLNQVWIFDHEGKFLQKLGKKGQGPGEYTAPLSVAVNSEGKIMVNDYYGMQIIFYDRNYQYERELKKLRGHYIHVNSKNEIYLYEGMVPPVDRGVFDTIKKVDVNGKVVLSFAPIPDKALKTNYSIMADGMDIDKNDFIYEMNSLYYQIRKYTSEGKLIKSFKNPYFRDIRRKGKHPLSLNGPFCLENGLLIIQREKNLDLFDTEGNFIVGGIPVTHKVIYARGNGIYLEVWEEAEARERFLNPKIICYQLKT